MLRILFVLALFISVGCSDKTVSPDTSPKVSTATSTTSIGDWSSTVEKVEEAVYALVFSTWNSNSYYLIFTGTGFSVDDGVIVTTGHVIDRLIDLNGTVSSSWDYQWIVVQNITTTIDESDILIVEFYDKHSRYNGNVNSPDVGIVWVDETTDQNLDVASRSQAMALKVGDPIGTMGFPDELQDLDVRIQGLFPIATFKNGTVSGLRPEDETKDFEIPDDTYIVQHPFDTTNGTSGSPIFDKNGRVVAVHNAAIQINSGEISYGFGSLGFGIRADKIQELLRDHSIAAKPTVVSSRGSAREQFVGKDISSVKMMTVEEFLANHAD